MKQKKLTLLRRFLAAAFLCCCGALAATAAADRAFAYLFESNTCTVTVRALPEDGGTVSMDKASPVDCGESVVLTATPGRGYKFSMWESGSPGLQIGLTSPLALNVTQDTVIVARFTPVGYTVKFDGNGADGGGTMADQIRTYKDGEKLPANKYARAGKAFSGWNTAADGSGEPYGNEAEGDLSETEGATVTLYAQWADTHTVTFDMQGHGTAPDAQTVASGTKAVRPADPADDGWLFGGWYKEAACTNAFNFGDPITADIILYAKWTGGVTFTFNLNMEGYEAVVQTLPRGGKAAKPADPTADGWLFCGWYSDLFSFTKEFDFGTAINEDTWVYAKWTLAYKVDFDVQGHGTAPDAQTVVKGGKAAKPADPAEEGWLFCGWYKEAACTNAFDFDSAINGNTKVYAKWAEAVTVSFRMQGHGTAPEDQVVAKNGKAAKPADPAEEGWLFGGWYKEKTCTTAFDFNTAITANTIVYARWTQAFTVSFNLKGHGGLMDGQVVAINGKVAKPADPTAEGWAFAGWYKDYNCTVAFDFNAPITANTVIYAQWTQGYTITFDMQGHGTPPAVQTVTVGGKAVKPADPTAEGCTFGGWYKEAACTTTFDFDAAITANTTVYAKWTQVFNVTFEMQGHGTAPAVQAVAGGGKAAKPSDPTADGWLFGGWYKEAACTTAFDFDAAITANTTVYAKWTRTFKVTLGEMEGAAMDPGAGVYHVPDGGGFQFRLTPKAGYVFYGQPKITTGIAAYDLNIEYTPVMSGGKVEAYDIRIKDVKESFNISLVGGFSPVGNEEVGGIRVWANAGTLYIYAAETDMHVQVYGLTGALVADRNVVGGQNTISGLPRGIYLVRMGARTMKVSVK